MIFTIGISFVQGIQAFPLNFRVAVKSDKLLWWSVAIRSTHMKKCWVLNKPIVFPVVPLRPLIVLQHDFCGIPF